MKATSRHAHVAYPKVRKMLGWKGCRPRTGTRLPRGFQAVWHATSVEATIRRTSPRMPTSHLALDITCTYTARLPTCRVTPPSHERGRVSSAYRISPSALQMIMAQAAASLQNLEELAQNSRGASQGYRSRAKMFSNSKGQCKRWMGWQWQGDCGEATSVAPAADPVRWLRIQAGGNMPLKPPPIWKTASVAHGSPTGSTQLAAWDPMPGDVLPYCCLKP